jgi:predicted lipoprotein with Yx(FWY)xxD motif
MARLALLLVLWGALASTAAATGAAGTVVKTAVNAHLAATILVDARGRTLYYFAQELPRQTPQCVNDPAYHCSKLWPPLLAQGKPTAGPGAKQSLLGAVKRPEGTMQVTYAGRALYRFAGGGATGMDGDRKPGDEAGQGFAGLWFVLSPAGKPITRTGTK